MNSYNRKIYSYLSATTELDEKAIEVDVFKHKLRLDVSILNYEEKIFPSNLIQFLQTFKENTMIIYEAILSDKKILFVGDSNTSCEKLSNYIFSTVSLYPVFGILKRIHPYKNLYDLDFLKSNNCIYAVTNPIFKNKTDYWDIMCEVDSGKVTQSEKFKQHLNSINRDSDIMFIKELLYKLNSEGMNDYEIERYFRTYTNHLFKVAGDEYFIDDIELSNEIAKQVNRKSKISKSQAWKLETEMNKIRDVIGLNGKSLRTIISHIHTLSYRRSIEQKELVGIYRDIARFMENETFINIVSCFII
jgi:hypothetical protein